MGLTNYSPSGSIYFITEIFSSYLSLVCGLYRLPFGVV